MADSNDGTGAAVAEVTPPTELARALTLFQIEESLALLAESAEEEGLTPEIEAALTAYLERAVEKRDRELSLSIPVVSDSYKPGSVADNLSLAMTLKLDNLSNLRYRGKRLVCHLTLTLMALFAVFSAFFAVIPAAVHRGFPLGLDRGMPQASISYPSASAR